MSNSLAPNSASLESPDDLGANDAGVAKRWKLELQLASKREADWRKRATSIYKIYTPDTPVANSFNILWTNTETLRQSVYNSLPQPDARRRYSDADPLGDAVGQVMTRALEFSQDTYDFDAVLKGDVLAMLLAGRTVSRVRYVPDIRSEQREGKIGADGQETEALAPTDDDESTESEVYEEIEWEQVICERVQWDDLRIGAGKTWDQVPWVAFRHRFTREECVEKFGESIGKQIALETVDDTDVVKSKETGDLFKTAEIWEIWDKDDKLVLFICPTFPLPCKVQKDPLELQGFFPIPRPLYAIENDQTLVPAALYTQYEQQARELNKVSLRINKLIDALRVRGIYDATLTELSELMKGQDNDLIPAQNVTALLERGGLEKAIWMMPIDTIAQVLQALYAQRDSAKQIIYEITGISDIMRSASDPNETFGAQKIKTQWGTQRLQRMQKEVQRYIRDLIRLKAEIISEKFQVETLEAMTLLQYPHEAEIQAQMQQYQMQAMMAQQQDQQPPPPPDQNAITWEAIAQALQNDATRTYRIDIETDSTLSATQDNDMEGLTQLLTGLTHLMQGFGPAVQEGAMSIDVVKELMLVVCRRAKMGTAVEDQINKIQQPPPKPDPDAGKAEAEQQSQMAKQQHEAQLQQESHQHEFQLAQAKAQADAEQHQRELQAKVQADQYNAELSMQVERNKQQAQHEQILAQNQLESQRAQQQAEFDHAKEMQRLLADDKSKQNDFDLAKYKIDMEYKKAIEVAEIASATTLSAAQTAAANAGDA